MEDFNADNAKIEAALTTLSGTVAVGVLEGYDGTTDLTVDLGRQPAMVMVGNRAGWTNIITNDGGTSFFGHSVALPGYPGYHTGLTIDTLQTKSLEVTETGFQLYAGWVSRLAPLYYLALFEA